MFKSVICVGEDFTCDLTGPVCQYWETKDTYYRWDGVRLLVRAKPDGNWVPSCCNIQDMKMCEPCDANKAELPA